MKVSISADLQYSLVVPTPPHTILTRGVGKHHLYYRKLRSRILVVTVVKLFSVCWWMVDSAVLVLLFLSVVEAFL